MHNSLDITWQKRKKSKGVRSGNQDGQVKGLPY